MPQTNSLCRGVSILVYIEDFLLSCLVGTLTVADKLSVLRQLLRVSQSCRSGEMGTLILQSRYAVRGRGRVAGLAAEMSDQLQKLPLAVIADDTTV